MVLAAFLRGAVAGVVHGEKMKTSAEVRERGRNGGCFRRGGGRIVVGIATSGGSSGGEAGGGPGWWLERWRERGGEKLQKQGQRSCFFFLILDPNFSSLRL